MTITKIVERSINAQAVEKLENANLNSTLARLYSSRGISSPQELVTSLKQLLHPNNLNQCDKAGALLANAVIAQEKVTVIADYDADGATSCALIVDFLRAVGGRVSYIVPDRKIHGYGLTPDIVELAAKNRPDWIVTVDNGIASVSGVEKANKLGIKTIITDHHLPGDFLPQAECIVNPNQKGCDFKSKNLCGVGVIFYVAVSIKTHLKERDWFANVGEPLMANYLDLVALGTVADVVTLDHNNRILVTNGIKRIRKGNCRFGIEALIELANRDIAQITTSDLAFAVAPRLNAAGRMDNMSAGIECLLAPSHEAAKRLGERLNTLNLERKKKEALMREVANSMIQAPQNHQMIGHTYYDESWHEGIIGIIASRIKEQINRPVIVFAQSINPDELKGSGRSLAGFHLRDALDLLTKRDPELVLRFGGHAMAAGLTIKKSNLQKFLLSFDAVAKESIPESQLEKKIITDGSLKIEICLNFITKLQDQVWGEGFDQPLFVDKFQVLKQQIVGEKHNKLKLKKELNSEVLDAIFFNDSSRLPLKIKAVYQLQINHFNGSRNIQLLIKYWENV